MMDIDSLYTSYWNGNTEEECINISMLKLLKDQIAFLHGQLSQVLRLNKNKSKSC